MNTKEIINSVLNIPHDFKEIQTKSVLDLLKESGYLNTQEEISQEDIINLLDKEPRYISDWIGYSHNKRAPEGWYIIEKNNHYIVGFLSKDNNKREEFHFQNSSDALAFFIYKEINNIKSRNI